MKLAVEATVVPYGKGDMYKLLKQTIINIETGCRLYVKRISIDAVDNCIADCASIRDTAVVTCAISAETLAGSWLYVRDSLPCGNLTHK